MRLPIPYLHYACSLRSLYDNRIPHFSRAGHSHGAGRRGRGIHLPTNSTVLPFTRNMSNSPTKRIFCVYAPDYTTPGTLDIRLSVREEHLKGIAERRSSGIASMCTHLATVTDPSNPDSVILFTQNLGAPFWHQNLPMRMTGRR